MKSFKLICLILLVLPMSLAAGNKFNGKHTKEKKIKKEFSVNSNAELDISNSYGNVDITTWNENRIVIEVTIKTNGNDLQKVEEKLDEIDVEFSASASKVTAKTLFSKDKGWSLWGNRSNNVSMEINYLVKMPENNSLTIKNNYGAISLTKIKGDTNITCNYGKLILGELHGNNTLRFDYTNNSTISYVNNATIKADYSGFVIDKAVRINYNGDYSKTEIKEVKSVSYKSNYGKITIGSADDVTSSGNYITHNFGTIRKSLNSNSNYGKINIDKLAKEVTEVTLNGKYTNMNIGYETGFSFGFSFSLSYGNVKGTDDFVMQTENIKSSSKEYSGYFGNPNSNAAITIASSYGNVNFSKN
jgi:hypothetical protein